MATRLDSGLENTQAVVFDLMGTCTDWKTAITSAMSKCPPLCRALAHDDRATLAQQWRAGFFAEIHDRFNQGLPGEDIDITHRRVLDRLLSQESALDEALRDSDREQLVRSWHEQVGMNILSSGTTHADQQLLC